MSSINAYLMFGGNCREAMTFYKDCLGGELTLMTVGESPVANTMPADAKDTIMHACLNKGPLVLMASDMTQTGTVQGNTVSLSLNCDSDEEIQRLFAALSDGGKVVCPLEEQFWGATFGVTIDKYGFTWMLSHDKK